MSDKLVICPECEGTGEIECFACDGLGEDDDEFGDNPRTCPGCEGSGEETCPLCTGEGTIPESKARGWLEAQKAGRTK